MDKPGSSGEPPGSRHFVNAMKFLFVAPFLAAWCWVPHASAELAPVDYRQSSMGFEVRSGDRSINGIFGRWSADIAFDLEDPEAASFEVIADISSITLSDQIAQTIVTTTAWLAADAFPVAAFESETVMAVGDRSHQVTGTLFPRGVAAPIELTVVMHDPSDITVADVTGQLDRTDFAIGSGFGAEIVDHLVTLNATVVFSQ